MDDDEVTLDRLIAEGKVIPARFSVEDLLNCESIELASGKSAEQLIREDREGRY